MSDAQLYATRGFLVRLVDLAEVDAADSSR